jgi:hypothetical protein
MHRAGVWGALFVLLLGADAGAAPVEDVLGREVPVGHGRPLLEFYGNRGTHDLLRAHAFDFAFGLRGAEFIVVVRVDLSDVPSLFRGYARAQVRESYERALEYLQRLFRARGEAPPAELADHVFFVADFGGESHRGLGLPRGFEQPLARVLNPQGDELFRAPFPQRAAALARAVARASE